MRGRDAPPESGPRLTRAAKGARVRLTATTTVRVDADVLARIDAIAAARSTEWRKVTRSEVLRELIGLGMDDAALQAPRTRHLKLVELVEGKMRHE